MKTGMKKTAMIIAMGSVIGLAGCAGTQHDPNVYRGSQSMQTTGYQTGFVDFVRPVTIQDDTTGLGGGAGAVIGGIAGSTVGGGTGQYIGAAVGALTLGLIGNQIESNASKTEGQEIGVKLNSGVQIIIVQDNTLDIKAGDRVRVIGNAGDFRVVRY